jgi:hypothetical protein
MRRTAIATAVLFVVNTSADAAPTTLVCNGTVSRIRWDVKAPAGIVIEDRMEGDHQWTVTIDTATKKLTLYPLPGLPLPGFFAGEGDIKSISMQASIDADKDANKGSPWEDAMPYDGSINRITGAFVVTVPTLGSNPRGGLEYSGNCKKVQPLF